MTLLTQDQLKTQVAQAALAYVQPGQILGVGSGSTVDKFIDALASAIRAGLAIEGVVPASEASTQRLRQAGIRVLDANAAESLAVYVDGADEIDSAGCMIKGGGAALTREKIVAALAQRFVCIADASKRVDVLGKFALPVEVIPAAAAHITRRFAALGGSVSLRMSGGAPLLTDNGQQILDVQGLRITDPLALEALVNQWPGVVTVGLFAQQKANICLLATQQGVQTLVFERLETSA
jgi:ribose 5-phosphate isomerase A